MKPPPLLYPIYVRKDAGSAYSAAFPDFPGCFAAADEAQDLPRAAQEAVEAHYGVDEEYIPEPSTPDAHAHSEEYRGGYWMLVEIDLSRLRSCTLHRPTQDEDAAVAAGIAVDPATWDLATPSELAFTAEQATLGAVRVLAGMVLELTYADGTTMQVDVAPIVKRAPVLHPLLDATVFAQAQVGKWGACVTWGTDVLELAADNLRARAANHGRATPMA